jgi:hypothetical protein
MRKAVMQGYCGSSALPARPPTAGATAAAPLLRSCEAPAGCRTPRAGLSRAPKGIGRPASDGSAPQSAQVSPPLHYNHHPGSVLDEVTAGLTWLPLTGDQGL